MAHGVFIDGAAGTTGLEIAERLAGRAEFDLVVLDEARRKDPASRAASSGRHRIAKSDALSASARARPSR